MNLLLIVLSALVNTILCSIENSIFQHKLSEASNSINDILLNYKKVSFTSGVSYMYEDKYALSEFISRGVLQLIANSFKLLGLNFEDMELLDRLDSWIANDTVRLQFRDEIECNHNRTVKVDTKVPLVSKTFKWLGFNSKLETNIMSTNYDNYGTIISKLK